jgi:hypothetical protein
MKAFRPNLMDFLLNQLKVQVETGEDRKGRFIKGLGLRCHRDPTGEIYPRPVTKKPFGGGGLMVVGGGCVVAETIGSGGWDGCDGLIENSKNTENIHPTTSPTPSQNQNCDRTGENNPQHPPNPPLPSTPAVTNPPQEPRNPSHPSKSSSLPAASKFKVGDRVQVRLDYPVNDELRGSEALVEKDCGDGCYQINFGREIKISDSPFRSKQVFRMDKKYLQIVAKDEPDL